MEANNSQAVYDRVLAVLPKGALSNDAHRRLSAFTEKLDQYVFLDEVGDVAVDRKTLIEIANNEEFVPRVLRDVFLVETSKHVGRRIKEFKKGRRISWLETEKHGFPLHPLSLDEIRSWGVSDKTSIEEFKGILKTRLPEIPAFLMNDNPRELHDAIMQRCLVNRTFWDCVVANLGWWAAITLGGGLIIFAILALSGVPWPIALLIAGIYQTGSTAYFLGQCLANPNFVQG
jgi:hypothetical protein